MRVLGIETSCDETGVAIFDSKHGLLGDALFSHVEIHAEFGGVVPELAGRAHMQKIIPVTEMALKKAGTSLEELDAIAFTSAPGLIGSLLVGAQFAKS